MLKSDAKDNIYIEFKAAIDYYYYHCYSDADIDTAAADAARRLVRYVI
jgi:hypothetical protein